MTKFEILDDGQQVACRYVENCGCQVLCDPDGEADPDVCPTYGASVQRNSYPDADDAYDYLLILMFGEERVGVSCIEGIISISVDTRTVPTYERVIEWLEAHDTMQLTDRYTIRKSAGVPTLL
jgi:hypothetical protein